jgi:hypothetical protein
MTNENPLSFILRKVLQHRRCSFESLRYDRKTLDSSVFASTLKLHIMSMELTLPSNLALVWGPLDSIRDCHFRTKISRHGVTFPLLAKVYSSLLFSFSKDHTPLPLLALPETRLTFYCISHVVPVRFMYSCSMCLRSIVLDLVMYPLGRSQCPSVCPAKLV